MTLTHKSTLLLSLLLSAALAAQEPVRFAPVFRNYSTDQGLPDNWVYGILQDRRGYLWVSTEKGVCRFDGYSFHQFPDTLHANETAVMTPNMMEDEAGRLWFVDFQNRVFYIENDRIIPWKHNDVLLDSLRGRLNDIAWIIVKDKGAEVLLGAHFTGILQVSDDGAWKILPCPEAASWHLYEHKTRQIVCPRPKYFKLSVPFSGNLPPLYFQTGQGGVLSDSLYCPGSKLVNQSYTGRLSSGHWLHFYLGYVYCFRSGKLLWFREYGTKVVAWATEDAGGAVYVGHVRGGGLDVYRSLDDFRQGRIAQHLLPGLSVSNIFVDREGGYWIGTQERGLFYCASLDQGRPETPAALREGIVKSLDWDRRNTLYAGTGDGRVFALDLRAGGVRDISPQGMTYLDHLHFDTVRQVLAASGAGQNARFYCQGTWDGRRYFDSILNQDVSIQGPSLFPTSTPDVWLTAGNGQLMLVDRRTHTVLHSILWTQKQRLRYYAARQDQSGRIWASSRQGLLEWRIPNSKLKTQHSKPKIEPAHQGYPAMRQRTKDIELLPDTSLVLAPLGHGVVFWKPGRRPLEINTGQGLLAASIRNLHLAPGGVIWACSERGVNKLTPDGSGGYRVSDYTLKDGLPTNMVYDALNIGNTVWLATDKGLFRMHEQADTSILPAPLSASVTVNNVPYFPGPVLSLPHDSTDISLSFVALHFRSDGRILYAFRLWSPGSDTSWTYTTDRRVNFPGLPPGRYRFEVKARSEGGAWSAVTALDIRIRPPWWATGWAYGGAALALAALVVGLYRYRVRQIRHENRIREEMLRLEQSALQAQMNPHFIFNCLNSIQNFILTNEPDAAVFYLAKFARLVRTALNASVRGEVTLGDEVSMLENYLALEQMRFKKTFDFSITVDPSLHRDNTFLPPLLVQPFVENAVLHGMKDLKKDGYIGVTFRPEAGYLYVNIWDNGPGLEREQADAEEKISLGGQITRRRLELLQQQKSDSLAVSVSYQKPENGAGTSVEVRIRMSR